MMRAFLVLGLILVPAFAEEPFNLDDINKTNQIDRKSDSTLLKSSYSVKPESDNEDYSSETNNYSTGAGLGLYATTHVNENDDNGRLYHRNVLSNAEQKQDPTEIQMVQKNPGQFYYEPVISVGNSFQTIQQKTATQKYLQARYKNGIYVSPPSQHLNYVPRVTLDPETSSKTEATLPEVASEAAQQIPVSVQTHNSHDSNFLSSPSFQIQPQYVTYVTKYPLHTQVILPVKKSRLYSQGSQVYSQPVIHRPQVQYLQQFIYPISSLFTPAISDPVKKFKSIPAYVHSRSLQQIGQLTQNPYYIQPSGLENTLPTAQSILQHYNKNQISSDIDLTPPLLPAQNFKTSQFSMAGESVTRHALPNYIQSSGPKSLLESYVPSHIIAAQDVERYRERPIKLESGFVPSSINFIHDKNHLE